MKNEAKQKENQGIRAAKSIMKTSKNHEKGMGRIINNVEKDQKQNSQHTAQHKET